MPGAAARPVPRPITITFDAGNPGPAVPDDFAGLSFERGTLDPGHAGVAGYLFGPENSSLVTLFRNLGLRNLRIGGGTVDQMLPAGTGSDGFAGIDSLFAFAAAAGARVIYTLRMLSPVANPVSDLSPVNARAAGVHLAAIPGPGSQLRRRQRAGLACRSHLGGAAGGPGNLRGGGGRAGQRVPVLPHPLAEPGRRRPGRGAGCADVGAGHRGLYQADLHPRPGRRGGVDGTVRPRRTRPWPDNPGYPAPLRGGRSAGHDRRAGDR